MDIDEWEFLSDDGFLDFNEDVEKQIFLGKRNSLSKTVIDMDYFCLSPKFSMKRNEASRNPNPRVPNQLVPLPIRLEPTIGKDPDDGLVREITKNPDEVTTTEKTKAAAMEADQDTVSQVFFKIKENEFIDMKMDSPKSGSRGLFPPNIDAGAFKFEDKEEAKEIMASPRMKIEKKEILTMDFDKEGDSTWEDNNNNGGFNIWKWSLTGVGAICSFGVAAVTVCVLFFGSQQRIKLQQDQKIRFQIYSDDKRFNQAIQDATKWNEAVSALRGVPLTRAHITYGGHYDGL